MAAAAIRIRITITVQTYGDYPMYATPDNEMITRMLHLPSDKNKVHNEQSAQLVTQHTTEYKIDNMTVYDIQDEICKDTDLYPYVKQHKSKRDEGGVFHSIHSRWLGPNHANATASEAEMSLQMSTYSGEKKAWNWEKYVACNVKYILSWETYRIWVPRPWSGMKSLIPVEQHLV